MKIPAALRPKWRELPGMAVATIDAYLLDASPRVRRLLRLPGFAFGALVVLPWLTAAHIAAVLAAVGDGRSGALVITDTRSLRARGAWIGCLVGAAFTVLVAFLAASAVLRLDAPAIVVYGVLLVIIAFVSTPLVVLIHPQRTEDRVHANTTAPVDRTRPPSGQAIVTPTLLAAWPRRAGNYVTIDHGGGTESLYMHMSAFAPAAHGPVRAGQLIGYVGSTGHSTGPHLHFEVRVNGDPYDPRHWLFGDPLAKAC